MIRRAPWLLMAVACQEYDVTSSEVTDTWVQAGDDSRTDVLFVVDDSGSMVEEQARLAANFTAFLEGLATSTSDFRIGVVSSTVDGDDGDGALVGGALGPDTEDLAEAVLAALLVGTEGARDEQGLLAADLALDGRNPDFPREGAELDLVFVSDEDDLSPDAVEDYLARWRTSAVAGLGVHGIVGDLPEGCATGTSAAEAGPRYIEAIEATAGHRASICADDYSPILLQLGLDAAGLPDTFPLTEVPRADTLEVRVDGVLMHEREQDGWTWSAGDNAIVFEGRAIPRSGMGISASYVPDVGVE